MSKSDEVFLISGGGIEALQARPFRTGLFGKTLEDALQTLIEKRPNILNGRQIAPGHSDPPRFVLLCRETQVGDWALDHVLVDQRGLPTLVEAKLLQNPEARRAVIGQILDYAAGAYDSWGNGQLRLLASEYWRRQGTAVENVLREEFGEIDIEAFWRKVETNLEESKLRLVIAADELRPEARRVIEFLNSQMRTVEVFGLEIRCFGEESRAVVVPFLVGQTQATDDQKKNRSASTARTWALADLNEAFTGMPDQRKGARLSQLLDWSAQNNSLITGTTQTPIFGVKSKKGQRVMSISPDWGIYLYFAEDRFASVADRDLLIKELRALDLLPEDLDPRSAEGKTLRPPLGDLTDETFAKLLWTLSRVC